jgi:hypothetical protein
MTYLARAGRIRHDIQKLATTRGRDGVVLTNHVPWESATATCPFTRTSSRGEILLAGKNSRRSVSTSVSSRHHWPLQGSHTRGAMSTPHAFRSARRRYWLENVSTTNICTRDTEEFTRRTLYGVFGMAVSASGCCHH